MKFEDFIFYHDNANKPSASHQLLDRQRVKISTTALILVEGKWKTQNMAFLCPLIKEWKAKEL